MNSEKVSVYPNLTNGQLKIKNVEIYDVVGNLQKTTFNFQLNQCFAFGKGNVFFENGKSNGEVCETIIV
jgi:hypothetical protein